MKKILILTIALFGMIISKAQTGDPRDHFLTDYSVQSDDTAYVWINVGRLVAEGGILDVHVILDSIDCDDSWWMVGASNVKNKAPIWPSTSGDISFPLVIDTTAVNDASQLTFRPLPYDDLWTFMTKWQWNSEWLVFATYKGSCTQGAAHTHF